MTASPAAAFFVEQNSTRQGGAARVTTAQPKECTLPLHSPLARCSIICSEKKANLKKNGTAYAVPTMDLGVFCFGGSLGLASETRRFSVVSKRRLRRLDTPPRPGVGSPIGRPSAAPIGQNFLGPVFAGAKKSVFVHEAHGRIRRTVPRDKTSQEGGFGAAVSGRWTLWAGLARSAAHKSTGIAPL